MVKHKIGRSIYLCCTQCADFLRTSLDANNIFENCQDLFGKGTTAVSALHSPGVAALGKKKRTKGFPAEAALASVKRSEGRRTANPDIPNKHSLTCKG